MRHPSLPWIVRLCGELRVEGEGQRYDRFPTRRSALLLARLAASPGHRVTREELCRLLWPDEAVPTAKTLLRNELARLRRALGGDPAFLLVGRSSVGLDADQIQSDLDVAEKVLDAFDPTTEDAYAIAEEALNLLGNSPATIEVPDETLEAARLKREFLLRKAAAGRAVAACVCEPLAGADRAIREALQLNPSDEIVVLAAIRRALRQGQNAEAARLYRDLAKALREIGATPAEEIRRLADVGNFGRTSEATPPSNLPKAIRRFVGRKREVQALFGRLNPDQGAETRLITLGGLGGIGKTRLSLEAGARLLEAYEERIWFFDLAELVEGASLPDTLLDQLGIERGTRADLYRVLAEVTSAGPSLFILDNFEQIDAMGAAVVEKLLHASGTLRVLVTSRRRLGIPGEQFMALPPLDAEESLELYLLGAPEASSDDDLRQLVGMLDGIPLAINLASSCGEVLGARHSVSQMKSRFDFLVDESMVQPVRHQRLWDTIEWSYQRLEPETQDGLRRLAIFRGGWTLEAANEILETESTHRLLQKLLASSFVVSTPTPLGVRFSLLETIREFGEEKWSPEERARLFERHFDCYRDFVDRTCGSSNDFEYYAKSRPVPAEYANLRQAFQWALHNDRPAAILMAHRLYVLWVERGHHAEGLRWMKEALLEPYPANLNTLGANFGAGLLALGQGLVGEARCFLERAIEIGFEIEDDLHRHIVVGRLCEVERREGHYDRADELTREGLEFFVGLENRFHRSYIEVERALALCPLGKLDEALEFAESGLRNRSHTRHGPTLAEAMGCVGRVCVERGETARAREIVQEARDRYRDADVALGRCEMEGILAELDLDEGRFGHAAERLSDLETSLVRLGSDEDLDRIRRLRARWLIAGDRFGEAAQLLHEALRARKGCPAPEALNLLDGLALLHHAQHSGKESLILGDVNRLRQCLKIPRLPSDERRLTALNPAPPGLTGDLAASIVHWLSARW